METFWGNSGPSWNQLEVILNEVEPPRCGDRLRFRCGPRPCVQFNGFDFWVRFLGSIFLVRFLGLISGFDFWVWFLGSILKHLMWVSIWLSICVSILGSIFAVGNSCIVIHKPPSAKNEPKIEPKIETQIESLLLRSTLDPN